MKKIIINMLLAFICISASAQELEWKVNAGIGSSNWIDDDNDDFSKAGLAYKIGVGTGIPFSKTWSLQTGLNFIAYRTELDMKVFEDKNNPLHIDNEYTQLYLDIPVMAGARLRLSDNLNLMIKAGPYFSYGIGGSMKPKEGKSESTFGKGYGQLNHFDSGFVFGLDLEMSNKLSVGLEGRGGFTKLCDLEKVKLYNFAGFLNIGYRL